METTDLTPDMLFPPHACGLYLIHNEHRDLYEPLAEFLKHRNKEGHFADAAALARSLATDELWELQWYPRTPGAFYVVAAPTLGELLHLAHHTAQADNRSHED